MSSRNLAVIIIVLVILGGGWVLLSSRQTQPVPPSISNTAVQPTESISPSTTSANVSETMISVTSSGFTPKDVTIHIGEAVTWVNNDTADHQINSTPHPIHTDYPPLNTVGLLKSGEKKSLSFPTAGTFKYHDHLNPTTLGSITVQ